MTDSHFKCEYDAYSWKNLHIEFVGAQILKDTFVISRSMVSNSQDQDVWLKKKERIF